MSTAPNLRSLVQTSFHTAPVVGVIRTDDPAKAARDARFLIAAGLELVEITFTVPGATGLVRELLAERSGGGPPWIGMGSTTTAGRADAALEAGAEFIVTPNVDAEVARRVTGAGRFLVVGALTPTEIVAGRNAGADLIKVYPLPAVGGASYLATVRGPLWDVPMLAAGGFGIEDIPAYAEAGAIGFGLGPPLLADSEEETRQRVERALQLARAGVRREESV
jgi:2-dehydro-3-deoxyphosphogluconate aldolase / (4S)-4-hydroxy-2-oxoglutarate aldolase